VFRAASVELTGSLSVTSSIDDAFDLFSPAGETAWVAGWSPEWLCPASADWVAGQVFRTRNNGNEVVWGVAALDRQAHCVEYHRLEPGRHVARVRVQCSASVTGQTEVVVRYHFVGLSGEGNEEISEMSPAGHAERMLKWQHWIEQYLRDGPRAADRQRQAGPVG
jgi:hypothetical protein